MCGAGMQGVVAVAGEVLSAMRHPRAGPDGGYAGLAVMRDLYRTLAVLGWVWCVVAFVFLAIKIRRQRTATDNSDKGNRVA